MRDGRRRGAGRQAGTHLGYSPEGGYPVLARLASGQANQAIGVVAAVELTSCKVPAGVSAVLGPADGTTTADAG